MPMTFNVVTNSAAVKVVADKLCRTSHWCRNVFPAIFNIISDGDNIKSGSQPALMHETTVCISFIWNVQRPNRQ